MVVTTSFPCCRVSLPCPVFTGVLQVEAMESESGSEEENFIPLGDKEKAAPRADETSLTSG